MDFIDAQDGGPCSDSLKAKALIICLAANAGGKTGRPERGQNDILISATDFRLAASVRNGLSPVFQMGFKCKITSYPHMILEDDNICKHNWIKRLSQFARSFEVSEQNQHKTQRRRARPDEIQE
jgi:hypothetical protein